MKNTTSKVDVHKVTGQVWLKTVKVIQKTGGKLRPDVSMEPIRDRKYKLRDTRWRFNFVNSLDQFIYFTQVNHISITQSQFQLRSRQTLLPPTHPSKTMLPTGQKREKGKNHWLVHISWWLGRFIKNEEIEFETKWTNDDRTYTMMLFCTLWSFTL